MSSRTKINSSVRSDHHHQNESHQILPLSFKRPVNPNHRSIKIQCEGSENRIAVCPTFCRTRQWWNNEEQHAQNDAPEVNAGKHRSHETNAQEWTPFLVAFSHPTDICKTKRKCTTERTYIYTTATHQEDHCRPSFSLLLMALAISLHALFGCLFRSTPPKLLLCILGRWTVPPSGMRATSSSASN